MNALPSFDWLQYVEKALIECDQIPIMGKAPSIDFKDLSLKLSDLLKIEDLKITAQKWTWKSLETFYDSVDQNAMCLNFSVLPLDGKVSAILSPMDINSITSWLIEKKSGSNTLVGSQFVDGLMSYLAVEALHVLQPQKAFEGFLLRLASDKELPKNRALVLDLCLEAYGEKVAIKLVFTELFHKNWFQHFLKHPKVISDEAKKRVEVNLSLSVAQARLTQSEWKKVCVGDFIPLEDCLYDPTKNSGSLYLSLGQKHLFRLRIKDEGLKILEQPIYAQGEVSMDEEEDLMSQISDSMDDKEESLDEDLNLDDDLDEEERVGVQVQENPIEKIENVPLNISIELAQFKMSCEKLLQLKPGNLLELELHPQKPVSLVVNGKKIATGELIRTGELIGVRILDLG